MKNPMNVNNEMIYDSNLIWEEKMIWEEKIEHWHNSGRYYDGPNKFGNFNK